MDDLPGVWLRAQMPSPGLIMLFHAYVWRTVDPGYDVRSGFDCAPEIGVDDDALRYDCLRELE